MSTPIYHSHHIIPRHAGGTDDPANLVRLTIPENVARQHAALKERHKEAKRRYKERQKEKRRLQKEAAALG